MASIKAKMQSLGRPAEKCAGCNRSFCRGEQMNGVEDSDGNPLGWFCDPCVDKWKKTGVMPEAGK